MNQKTTPPDQSDFGVLSQRVERLEDGLKHNTEATERIEQGVSTVIELLKFAHSGYGFFSAIGRGLRRFVVWITPFLALAGMVWALMHGRWPDKP